MKNQHFGKHSTPYFAIAVFMIFSIVACGNNTENSKVEEFQTNEVVISEEKIEEEVVSEKVTEAPVQEEIVAVKSAIPQDEGPTAEPEIIETPEIEESVNQPDPVPARPDHSNWNTLLKKYVAVNGKVDYKGMKSELPKIKKYLDHLNATSPQKDWDRSSKLAYWINLYNAATVYLVASNYPTSSITKLSGGKPWDKKFVKSGSKVYSLNNIEHDIVRPRFKDPRIHAALNCAAVSCPNLLNEAYTRGKLEAQLTKQTKVWINDASKNKLAPNKIQVSQLFEWYKVDFTASGGVIKFVSKYSIKKFIIDPKAKVSYLEYNWALNE